jgi:hypothetical protein
VKFDLIADLQRETPVRPLHHFSGKMRKIKFLNHRSGSRLIGHRERKRSLKLEFGPLVLSQINAVDITAVIFSGDHSKRPQS